MKGLQCNSTHDDNKKYILVSSNVPVFYEGCARTEKDAGKWWWGSEWGVTDFTTKACRPQCILRDPIRAQTAPSSTFYLPR